MPETIGTAYVQIEPSAKGISGSIENILSPEADKAGKSAGGKLSSALGGAAKVGLGAVAGIATAFVGTTAAITNATKSTAEYGDNIDKMSQKLGVSSSFYQEWDAVLQHSGTSMDAMGATFKKLATESQNASKDQVEAFNQLGLSMEQVKSMSTEELFTSVITGLQGMEEGTERTALATQLLGKGAMEMGALLNTSASDTQAMIDTVHELGGVMSDDAVKASAQFQDSLQNMQTAFQGVTNKLMAEFMPSMTEIMDGLGKLASGDDSGLGLIKQGITDFLNNLTSMLPQVLEVGVEILKTLGQALIDNLPLIADTAVDIVMMLIDGLTSNLPKVIEIGIELIVKLIVGLTKALPQLVEKAPEIIMAIVKGLISATPELISAGKDMVEGIWQGIKSMWGKLKENVKQLASSLVDSLKDKFKIGSPSKVFRDEVGQWIPAGVSVGIDSNLDTLKNSMSNMQDVISTDMDVSTNYAMDYDTSNSDMYSLMAEYLPMLSNIGNMSVSLEGDAKQLFRAVRKENNAYRKSNGASAFA